MSPAAESHRRGCDQQMRLPRLDNFRAGLSQAATDLPGSHRRWTGHRRWNHLAAFPLQQDNDVKNS